MPTEATEATGNAERNAQAHRRHAAPSPCPGTPGRNGAVLPADGKTPLRCTGTAGEARGAGPCRRGERALPHGGAGRRSGRAAIRNHLAGTRLSLASLLFALLLATTACTASAGAGGSEGRSAAGSPSAAAEAAAPSAEAAPSPESEAPDVAGPADERPQGTYSLENVPDYAGSPSVEVDGNAPSFSEAKRADASAENRRGWNGTLEEAQAQGYQPCGRCNP